MLTEAVNEKIDVALPLGQLTHIHALDFARASGLTPISSEDLVLLSSMLYAAWLTDGDDPEPDPEPAPEPRGGVERPVTA